MSLFKLEEQEFFLFCLSSTMCAAMWLSLFGHKLVCGASPSTHLTNNLVLFVSLSYQKKSTPWPFNLNWLGLKPTEFLEFIFTCTTGVRGQNIYEQNLSDVRKPSHGEILIDHYYNISVLAPPQPKHFGILMPSCNGSVDMLPREQTKQCPNKNNISMIPCQIECAEFKYLSAPCFVIF